MVPGEEEPVHNPLPPSSVFHLDLKDYILFRHPHRSTTLRLHNRTSRTSRETAVIGASQDFVLIT